jgi:hypothetical protein
MLGGIEFAARLLWNLLEKVKKMFRENFENKALKNIRVLEPWLDHEPGPRKPLFGAVIFEFDEGHNYFFRSPLRYSWPAFDDRSELFQPTDAPCCIPQMCDAEEVAMHRRLLVDGFRRKYGVWYSLWAGKETSGLPGLYPELNSLKGLRLIEARMFTRRSFLMRFENFGALYFTYLAGLDGSIQVANGGWAYTPEEIVVHGPEYAFGYLSDRADFTINISGKSWPNVDDYVQAMVRRVSRGGRVVTPEELSSFAKLAREAKFEQHPELRRRDRGKKAVRITMAPGETVD